MGQPESRLLMSRVIMAQGTSQAIPDGVLHRGQGRGWGWGQGQPGEGSRSAQWHQAALVHCVAFQWQ